MQTRQKYAGQTCLTRDDRYLLHTRTKKDAVPSEQTQIPVADDTKNNPTDSTTVYVVTEYWCPESISAAKGEGSQIVAVLTTLEAANALAKQYQEHCVESIIAEDKANQEDAEDMDWDHRPVEIELSESAFKDGRLELVVHWAHCTTISVKARVLDSKAEDVKMPDMLMFPTCGH